MEQILLPNGKELKAGDCFASANPWRVGLMINAVQRFYALDGKSEYSHTGIIADPCGKTIEALRTVCNRNLFDHYAGKRVLIARPLVKESYKIKAIRLIEDGYLGNIYPAWRLALHLFPPAARYISANGIFLVCSELTAFYLYHAGARHNVFTGVNPDNLADEWRNFWIYAVIYEGYLQ